MNKQLNQADTIMADMKMKHESKPNQKNQKKEESMCVASNTNSIAATMKKHAKQKQQQQNGVKRQVPTDIEIQ